MTKYPKGSCIVRNGERRKVLEELGELRFLSTLKSEGRHWETEMAVCVCEHTQELERQGWKVEEVKEERIPKVGESYWAVGDDGLLGNFVFTYAMIGAERIKVGNCFRTYEEAEAAAERVKKAYRGE